MAPVAVGPAIEAATLHRGQVVRDQVIAEFITFVHYRPQRVAVRLPCETDRITQPRGEHRQRIAGDGVVEDRGALRFGGHPVFDDIAVGSHADIQMLAVDTRQQVLGPVVVEFVALARQADELLRGDVDAGLARGVRHR